MVESVASAGAPYGRIGKSAFVSAKQADAVKESLAKAGESSAQKAADASLAKLQKAAGTTPVNATATSNTTSSAAVTAQNVDNQSKGKSANAAPYGAIGGKAFASAEQADKVKAALGKAGASMITPAPGSEKNQAAAKPEANAKGAEAAAATGTGTAKANANIKEASKDAPFGSIGGKAFASAEQADKVKAALAKAGGSADQKAADASLAKLQKAANSDVQVAASGAGKATASAAVTAQDAEAANSAKAFENLAKAKAAYSAFNR